MNAKKIIEQFNIVSQCRKYGLSIWQCPQFIFILMGLVIIASTIAAYFIGNRYIDDPYIVALIVLFITMILFIMAYIITHSFERLAEANRMKSEFVSVVSHQLRAPLSNLKWGLELLMSGRIEPVSDKQSEYFKILKENSERMADLISDLLIVARIEQGRFFLKEENVSLKELLKKSIQEMEVFSRASNVEVETKIEDNLPTVMVNPSQIKLVIDNLLDNAIRYTRERGGVEVFLGKKKNNICLTVKDKGVGIPLEDQKYIFQKFFRSANALRHKTEGSGLGLYIAKSIIEKFGGKIGFKSQENVGSTFYFTLPIK